MTAEGEAGSVNTARNDSTSLLKPKGDQDTIGTMTGCDATSSVSSSRELTLSQSYYKATYTVESVSSLHEVSAARKFLILATLAAAITAADLTSFGAFFTTAALSKNANGGADYHTAVGAVYAMLQIGTILAAPLVTRELPYIGSKYMMALSMASMGVAQVIFAFVDRIADWRVFLVYCYIIRIMLGITYAGLTISASSYLTAVFPSRLGFVNGFVFTFAYAGHALGMFLGGALFDAGGYPLPFLTTGVPMLVVAVAIQVAVQEDAAETVVADADTSEKHIGVRVILRYPWVWVLLTTLTVAMVTFSGVEAVLGPRMQSIFGSRAITVGGALSAKIIVAAGTCPAVGSALDAGYSPHVFVVVSFLLTAVACLLLGPASFLHLPSSLWLVYTSMIAMAVGHIGMTVSIIYAMTQYLQRVGVGSAMQVRVAIAGISWTCMSGGFALAPILTTALVALMDFQAVWTLYAFVHLAAALAFGVLSWVHSRIYGHAGTAGHTGQDLGTADTDVATETPSDVITGSEQPGTEESQLIPRK
ncbi:MFS-type transporter SLC18B1-like [Sycon ciliatum]|uniref:MFS-type transporter SLC18B1-like n=1 Tax=Sycon ciliatum TaxID=27933 RepID=UPI0020A8595D|eukprot:scpid49028/ scgid21053/ MFS-type transporter SLC18B1; Solute carrier family 18 member B1